MKYKMRKRPRLNPRHQRHSLHFRAIGRFQKQSVSNVSFTSPLAPESKWNWIITDMLSFLMLGLELSDSTMVTASGVRTYIFHVAAQPPGFSAA